MPEGLEIEYYRRLAETTVGRRVEAVVAPDPWYLKRGLDSRTLADGITGARVEAARRVGKLLLLDLRAGPTVGLRFGMTGRLLVDDRPAIEHLEYASRRDDPAWDRLVLRFAGGGSMVMRDPRRLGGVELDPDEGALGPDLFDVRLTHLRGVLAGSDAPIKARLLDQQRVAGIGNLLADEMLWRAGIDPTRRSSSLDPDEQRRLARAISVATRTLLARGGSHTGDLMASRHPGGRCPRDGAELQRRTVGGRTTYSCPTHQR